MPEKMTIAEMTYEVREINTEKGWREQTRTHGDLVGLIHTEIAEILDAWRVNGLTDPTRPTCEKAAATGQPCIEHGLPKPEGVGSEAADVLIRLLDMFDTLRLPLTTQTGLENVPRFFGKLPLCPGSEANTFGDYCTWLHRMADQLWTYDLDRLVDARQQFLQAIVTFTDTYDIDLDAEYARKTAYNRTRAYRYGGKLL